MGNINTTKPAKGIEDPSFTPVQLQLIRLICRHYENSEISVKLKRSLQTVEGYRAEPLRKMGVKDTAGLVVYAIKAGIYVVS